MPARWLAALFALAVAAAPGHAGERYFVVLFGSQSPPRLTFVAHTFATAVKVTDDLAAPGGVSVDAKTISWLPATLVIRGLHLRPEPGVNLSLADSLKYAADTGQRMTAWGPYEIPPDSYGRLVRQYDRVAGGFYQYQAVDSLNPDPRVANCIHAVTDTDPRFGRGRYPLLRVGDSATHHIVRQFFQRDRIIDPAADHGWLLGRLGVPGDVVRHEFVAAPGGPGLDLGWRVRPPLPTPGGP